MLNSIVNLFTTPAPDFQVLWLAARDFLTPVNPYINPQIFTGVGYPPTTLLFYLPLTFLNYYSAQLIFLIISLSSLFLYILLSFRILEIKVTFWKLAIALFLVLISFPTKFTLGMGQNNLIVFVLLLSSYFLYKKKNFIPSGILLGLAFSYKTVFAYFLLFFILKKAWKVVGYSLATFLVSAFMVFVLRGSLDLFSFYVFRVIPPLFNFAGREIYYNQGLSAFVSRFITDIQSRRLITLALTLVLWA